MAHNYKLTHENIFEFNEMSLSDGQTVNLFNRLFFPTGNITLLVKILQNGTEISNSVLSFLLKKEILNAANINEIKLDLDNLIKFKTFYSDDLIEKLFKEGLVEMRINCESFVRLFARNNLNLCRCLLEKIELSEN